MQVAFFTPPKSMHPADIKALLEKAGATQVAIASAVHGRDGKGVSRAAVHHVIRGLSRSQAIARHISQVVGQPVSRLWPGKYPEIEASEGIVRRGSAQVSSSKTAA